MAEKLTPQQEMAVRNRSGKLLVSAAAGSGKTKVLVDRLLSYLTDPVSPANLDDFLIITYTKAAAAELRGKIAKKLSERIAEDPQNRHLQKQMQRLYLAKISTVHSFCGDILREFACFMDLPADFRVIDENETAVLRMSVINDCLNDAYDKLDDPDFRTFVDSQAMGRNDRSVPDILLKLYERANCQLDPMGWLDSCVDNAQVGAMTDAGQTIWGQYLIDDLHGYLQMQIEAMTQCLQEAEMQIGIGKQTMLLGQNVETLNALLQMSSWDEIVANNKPSFGTLTFGSKCPAPELAERIKAVRNACKAGLEKKLKAFCDPSNVVLADLQQSASAIRGMVKLVKKFEKDYRQAKLRRRMLDFGDLEHLMVQLLLGKSRSGPTSIATEIGDRFREIMVDEYQDSNAVQDAIFSALTQKRQNCFMVGDVKQSIYQFRMADPTIFLEKYQNYADADQATDLQGRKVMLSSNFRSGGAVLAGVNDVFEHCMSPKVGGLHYGPEEMLREGIPHTPLGEPEVELWTIPVAESTYEEEAAFVAQRIVELTDGTHFVRNGDTLRPIVPEDVAILLRSPGSSAGYFKRALAARGIECCTGGGENLLEAQEICVLRSLLQCISNPRQDIPLLAVLASPIFYFTADDLVAVRCRDRGSCFYDALRDSEMPKAQEFLVHLSRWRVDARMHSLARLLESIFTATRLDSIYGAMSDGETRLTNIEAFYQLAVDYEKTGRRDLEQFLDYLDAMDAKKLVIGGEQSRSGMVTIMSIHKSKGLEFPVVFVSNLSKTFNREDLRAKVLHDQDLGLGLVAADTKIRVQYPTIAKRAIISKLTADSVSEEMRVLYVALTRARDRLIMTYASQTLEKDLAEIALRGGIGPNELLTSDVSCMGDWVLMAAMRRTEAGELFALGARPRQTSLGEPPWLIRVQNAPVVNSTTIATQQDKPKISDEMVKRMRIGLSYQYPHMAATMTPSKQTATQRKGRMKDAEVAENAPPMYTMRWRQPNFAASGASGADVGTATHRVMQYIRYEQCADSDGIRRELERLTNENYITAEQARMVNADAIAAFFQTELGQKLRKQNQVLREFKFSILDDAANFGPELSGEQILLQGVVDCAMVEEDGITVIDFKTDHVTEETVDEKTEHYRPQVRAYADAMQRIYEKPVKEAWLYYFRLNRFVRV